MQKSKQQALYDNLWASLSNYARVFDYTPQADVGYPFITLNEYTHSDVLTKTAILPDYQGISFHLWSLKNNRLQHTTKLENIRTEIYQKFDVQEFNHRTLIDTTTNDVLLHTVVDLIIKERKY